jgi:hypothetical protein
MDNNNTLDRNIFEQFAYDNVSETFRSKQDTIKSIVALSRHIHHQPDTTSIDTQETAIIPNNVFIKANTSFPFVLFPDTISVDTTKVSIIKRSFFMTSQAFSIRVEDILDVTLSLGPFFGSIQIHTRFYDLDKSSYCINWLKRSDAIKIKHILHGYVIARHNGIDLSKLTREQQLAQMIALGHE